MTSNILSNCAQYVISMSYIIISFNENKGSNKKYQTFIDTFGVMITSNEIIYMKTKYFLHIQAKKLVSYHVDII